MTVEQPKNSKNTTLEDDFAYLAKLAAAESYQDVRLHLARMIRKYRDRDPAFAKKLDAALSVAGTRGAPSVLRRESSSPLFESRPGPSEAESGSLLIRINPNVQMQGPLLAGDLALQVSSIIQERRESDRLRARGIAPTRSAILVGAPGVGKTMTARWIAHELGKPLLILDLAAVMSSLLGKTGTNLRSALNIAKAESGILLLDEIDAIAKTRNDDSDVGELKRLVTVILQEVDQWPDNSLLLAATNHPELVDRALWRRFDVVLNFTLPSTDAIRVALPRYFGSDAEMFTPWLDSLADSFAGKSLSDVERSIAKLRRTAVFSGMEAHELMMAQTGIDIKKMPLSQRRKYALLLAKTNKYSQYEIHRITGISRPTLRKHAGTTTKGGGK